ncbi:MAG: (Fe-S)-binding protein [SAR202 cluster bacterium]|nr:(Fe-S)-binding protein [SAR202 cluster bacterium]
MSDQPTTKASLFVTCLVDQLFPQVGEAVVNVLRRQGVAVDFPASQTCCGQPLFNSGFRRDAAKLAKRVLKQFEHSQYVVVPSGSCAAMFKIFYPDLFQGDAKLETQAKALAAKTHEFSQFLVNVLKVTNVDAAFDGKVTYHPSCHLLRELGAATEPETLLRAVQGLDYTPLPDAKVCCGFGGTFSVKHAGISEGMLNDKIQNIAKTAATTLVACDSSCLMHIGGALTRRGLNVKTRHLAELLNSGPSSVSQA